MSFHSYWQGVPLDGTEEDRQAMVRWCQEIDADCNDCRHFQRERFEKESKRWIGACGNPEKQPVYPAPGGKVYAFPVNYTGNPCFVHRRG